MREENTKRVELESQLSSIQTDKTQLQQQTSQLQQQISQLQQHQQQSEQQYNHLLKEKQDIQHKLDTTISTYNNNLSNGNSAIQQQLQQQNQQIQDIQKQLSDAESEKLDIQLTCSRLEKEKILLQSQFDSYIKNNQAKVEEQLAHASTSSNSSSNAIITRLEDELRRSKEDHSRTISELNREISTLKHQLQQAVEKNTSLQLSLNNMTASNNRNSSNDSYLMNGHSNTHHTSSNTSNSNNEEEINRLKMEVDYLKKALQQNENTEKLHQLQEQALSNQVKGKQDNLLSSIYLSIDIFL